VSKPKPPKKVKLTASLIGSDKGIIRQILPVLQDRFGDIDFISERMEFHHTEYYYGEMGGNLFRKIVSFDTLIDPEMLPEIKIQTNFLEDDYADNGRRKINIDPGYIAMEKMVIASCKNFAHRIYLAKGVYADLTLIYKGRSFQPLEWTFPDYAEEGMRNLLNSLRERYMYCR